MACADKSNLNRYVKRTVTNEAKARARRRRLISSKVLMLRRKSLNGRKDINVVCRTSGRKPRTKDSWRRTHNSPQNSKSNPLNQENKIVQKKLEWIKPKSKARTGKTKRMSVNSQPLVRTDLPSGQPANPKQKCAQENRMRTASRGLKAKLQIKKGKGNIGDSALPTGYEDRMFRLATLGWGGPPLPQLGNLKQK